MTDRITLEMTGMDAVMAISENNPGAISVCMLLAKAVPTIDPQNVLGSLGAFLWLDAQRVYGSRIWALYKDVCGKNVTSMIGIMRAAQLGLVSMRDLNRAIDGDRGAVYIAALVENVKDRLKDFDRANAESAQP